MKTFTKALVKTAAKIEKSVQNTVHDVAGPKAVQDYELVEQVGSAGPGYLWKLYRGKPKSKSAIANSNNSEVCVWILDKKALADERHKKGTSKAAEEQLFEVFRSDAANLPKLLHHGVVRVIEPLDESKYMMAMATEPIFSSLANALKDFTNVNQPSQELKNVELAELEIKHGLLQIAEGLHFMHTEGHLVHRAVSPQNIVIGANGAWKLCGLGFATAEKTPEQPDTQQSTFYYPEYDMTQPSLPLQPPLDYVAPELTRNNSGSATMAADIFSLALIACRLCGGVSMVNSQGNLKTYQSAVLSLHSRDFHGIPAELVYELRRMLSLDPSARPSAVEFGGVTFFRDDPKIRALRFLDRMTERDTVQKIEFLKALGGMLSTFDSRVLRYKVLPPLAAELRNDGIQTIVIPMIMSIAESQDKKNFETTVLPALLPAMQTASGDALLLLLKHAPVIVDKITGEILRVHLLPMFVRALDDSDVRMQEEVLRRTVATCQKLDYQSLKQSVLPRLHGLALKTSSAAVRVHALVCVGELIPRMDKPGVMEVLTTCSKCVAVDKSAPTLMCVLGIGDVLLKQQGLEFAAEFVLPLLTPLILSPQLNANQFAKYMKLIRGILSRVEEKRGMGSGVADLTSQPAATFASPIANGNTTLKAPPGVSSASATSTTLAWDVSDWTSSSKPSVLALDYAPAGGGGGSGSGGGGGGGGVMSSNLLTGGPGLWSQPSEPFSAPALQNAPAQPLGSGALSNATGLRDFDWMASSSSSLQRSGSMHQNSTSSMNQAPSPSSAAWGTFGGAIQGPSTSIGSGPMGSPTMVTRDLGSPSLQMDSNNPFGSWPAPSSSGSSGSGLGGPGPGGSFGSGNSMSGFGSGMQQQQQQQPAAYGSHSGSFAMQGGRGPSAGMSGMNAVGNTAPRQTSDYGSNLNYSPRMSMQKGPTPPRLQPPPGGVSRSNASNRANNHPQLHPLSSMNRGNNPQPPPLLDLL